MAFASADGELLVEGVEGTGDTPVSGHAAPAALPADLRAAVEGLARDVAARLGGPQDIEWAAANGRIWRLQARPLTVPLPNPPLDRRPRAGGCPRPMARWCASSAGGST